MIKYTYSEPGQLHLGDEAPVGLVVEFYDSIHELPMRRLNEFNIHLAQDSGMGSTLADFDNRQNALATALETGSIDNAKQEYYNSRLGLFLMLAGISTKARALADVAYSINGIVVVHQTDDEVMATHKLLSDWMSQQHGEEVLDALKKKFNRELKVAFPGLFPDAEEIDFFIHLVKRARLQLNHALYDADVDAAMAEINTWLAEQMAPANYDFEDSENAVETKRRDFAKIVAGLAMKGIAQAGNLSAYDFHASIQVIKDNIPTPRGPVTQ